MAATEFDHTIGYILIGVLFSAILYACTCAQCIYYARKYPNDRFAMRVLVIFLWMLDTATLILDAECLYQYIVKWHAKPLSLISIPLAFAGEFFLVALIGLIVQFYFIHKIWDLLGTKWYRYPLTIAGVVIAIASLVSDGVVVHVIVKYKDDILTALGAAKKPKIVQCVTAVLADLYIMVLLCLTLRGSKSGFKRTNRLVNKLIVYTVNRGSLTVAMQLCGFLTYVAKINEMDLLWIIFWMLGGRVYVNSLLAVLNVRHHLRETTAQRHSEILQMLDFPHRSHNTSSSSQIYGLNKV